MAGDYYASGIGFIYNIPDIMENGNVIATAIGAETMEVYIVTVCILKISSII